VIGQAPCTGKNWEPRGREWVDTHDKAESHRRQLQFEAVPHTDKFQRRVFSGNWNEIGSPFECRFLSNGEVVTFAPIKLSTAIATRQVSISLPSDCPFCSYQLSGAEWNSSSCRDRAVIRSRYRLIPLRGLVFYWGGKNPWFG